MTVVTHVTILDQSQENVFGVRLQGKLDDRHLRTLASELEERSTAHGRLRVLLELNAIKNFTANELWAAMRLSCPQIDEVERLALVCDDEDYYQRLVALPSGPIESEVRHFQREQLRAAWEWLRD